MTSHQFNIATSSARSAEMNGSATARSQNSNGVSAAIQSDLTARNRANAQNSTGPRTPAGQAISKLNAVKSGLTGRTVVLPSDDAARYEQHVENWRNELQPQGPRECSLVQAIADAYWRTERIVRLEFALYAQGHAELSGNGSNHAEQLGGQSNTERELATYLKFEKQLRNLTVQEGRIRRQREKDLRELRDLQDKRLEQAEAGRQSQTKVSSQKASAKPTGMEAIRVSGNSLDEGAQWSSATKSGFEFSTAHLEGDRNTKLTFTLPNVTKKSA